MNMEWSTAVELGVRVTLVFVVGALVAVLVRRQAASIRHLALSATLGGALVMAVLVPWAPRLDVPLFGWTVERFATMPAFDNRPSVAPLPDESGVTNRSVDDRLTEASAAMRVAFGAAGTPTWLAIWMTGAAIVLLWGIVGRLGLVLLARRAQPLTDGPWRDSVDEAARALNVTRPIRILVSDRVGAPVTWGARRPVLVVPNTSDAWSDSVRRSVAAHEVAHISRNDYLHQLAALAACAVYWFHPLTWALVRRMRQSAERACDDLVLAHGTSGEDYATHLIGVARGSRALRLAGAVAIGMARPSTLEGRIMAVLDSTRRRGEPSRRTRQAAVAAAAGAIVALGILRPVPAEARVNEFSLPILPPLTVSETEPVVVPAPRPASVAATQGNSERRSSQEQDMEDAVNVRPGELLELDLTAGGTVTIRSWDENRVQVRTRLGGDDWRDVTVRVDRQSSGVLVEARFARNRGNHSTSNRFDIMVPRRFDVRISSSGGNLSISDVDGEFRGHTGGGGLTLERVSGRAALTTGGGEIRVSDSNLSGRVSTGGGTVILSRVSGGLRGSSGSGPVIYGEEEGGSGRRTSTNTADGVTTTRTTTDLRSLDVGDGANISIGRNSTYRGGSLVIDKAGGDINLNAAPNGARVHTGGGDVSVGEAGGDVSATTGGGNVTVGPVAGSVRASTGAGQVHVIVDRLTGRDQIIEAWSGKGRIIIELPRDFEGRLELETAHTRTHEETSRIRSDFEIDREPLTGWEDREGTVGSPGTELEFAL